MPMLMSELAGDVEVELPDGQAAVLFATPDFDSSQTRLMGRHVANSAFVNAFARHGRVSRHFGVCAQRADFDEFTKTVRTAAGQPQLDCVRLTPADHDGLSKAGLLYVPTATISSSAWLRRQASQRAYSICGITHAISYDRVTQGFADLLIAPLQPWDALICTSRAVRSAFEALYDEWGEYLRDRLAVNQTMAPLRLPVIPLGVDTSAFPDGTPALAARAKWRQQLGIATDDFVFLFSGRLSHHCKANPTPMYQAIEAAAAGSQQPIHLVHYGWFAADPFKDEFSQAVTTLCPSVRCHFVDGSGPDLGPHSGIWHAADVFTSLSDNIQESFGLVPVEAMAAGLPVVVSDWDGYRDTVRDGVDGFTIPTLGSPPGSGGILARFYESGSIGYNAYVGNACLATSVDTAACTRAYRELLSNEPLRRRLGDAARRRAREEFDWGHIIRRYQDLWRELAAIRRDPAVAEQAPRREGRSPNPTRPDPYTYTRSFPTEVVRPDAILASAVPDLRAAYQRVAELDMNRYGYVAVGRDAARLTLLDLVSEMQPCTVEAFLKRVPAAGRSQGIRTLVWLAKLGLIAIGEHNRG